MQRRLKTVLILALTVFGLYALAEGPAPLTFQDWKNQQILDAQNQTLRISARITQLKNSKHVATEGGENLHLPNRRIKIATDADSLTAAEKDLKHAQESLEAADALQLDDYVTIYLPTLQDQPEALNKLSEKLSKEELGAIFKALVKKGNATYAAPHNARSEVLSSLER